MRTITKFWIGIALLIVLSPLGLILPHYTGAGSAWGEWGIEEVKSMVGYIPAGLQKLAHLWKAPLSEYTFQGWKEKALPQRSVAYMLTGLMGIIAVACVTWLLAKYLTKKRGSYGRGKR